MMKNIDLQGLCILNTRPLFQGASQRFADLIESHGGKTHPLPMQELKAAHFTPPESINFQKIIFVSQAAVYFFFQRVKSIPSSMEVIAIGEATATALQQQSTPVHHYATDATSESLLLAPCFQNIAGQAILWVKGAHGRTHIGEELAKRQAKVTELIVYQSALIHYDKNELLDIWPKINIVLMTSEQAFTHLKNLCPKDWLLQQSILCFSQRLADIAKKSVKGHILICQHNQILETLLKYKVQHANSF